MGFLAELLGSARNEASLDDTNCCIAAGEPACLRPGTPWIFASRSPATMRAPRLPPTSKPANATALRVSGASAFDWCSTPPQAAHAASGDDDARKVRVRQLDRLRGLGDDAHAVEQRGHLARRHPQRTCVAPVQRGGLARHRAVEKDRQLAWHEAGLAQPLQHEQQRLRAADRERRPQHRSAASSPMAGWAQTGPRKACFASAGSQLLWSRWAWLLTTASRPASSGGDCQ
jgi:hypothetical protein